ncbi:hypothetical protein TNCT_351071 [Trichonephila clavata]|uniref:Uncharacterized protein n=1 Tax=Trichonephila clavata TaxID=2740835 RepID=A0A8X6LZ28_TRICU|nr:hypothetical protein TNCT_351071 [Trichonephila clavata]
MHRASPPSNEWQVGQRRANQRARRPQKRRAAAAARCVRAENAVFGWRGVAASARRMIVHVEGAPTTPEDIWQNEPPEGKRQRDKILWRRQPKPVRIVVGCVRSSARGTHVWQRAEEGKMYSSAGSAATFVPQQRCRQKCQFIEPRRTRWRVAGER